MVSNCQISHLRLAPVPHLSAHISYAHETANITHLSHGGIRVAISNSATHNAQPLNMLRKIRILLEHHRNIRQSTRSHQERCVLRRRHQGLVHSVRELEIRGGGLNGLRQQCDAVQARLAWLCSAVCFGLAVVRV